HVGIDAVLPWGARVQPHRHDVPALARFAFATIDPGLPERAARAHGGRPVAGAGVGAGERRVQAALVLVQLGIRAVLARSFGAAWRADLVAQGILPLAFSVETDGADVAAGDELEIPDLPDGLEPGRPLVVRNLTRGLQLTLRHDLNPREIATVRAGGVLRALAAPAEPCATA